VVTDFKKMWLCATIAIVLMAGVLRARGQVLNSPAANANLIAPLAQSVGIISSPSTINFTLAANGTAAGSSSVTIVTTWNLEAARTSLKVYAYFSSSTAALTDSGSPANNIGSAHVLGSVDGGANVAFNSASPFASGSSITVYSVAINSSNRNSSHANTLGLTIDTAGLALPAATYNGTLLIQAQSI
jgi:hypothetical protein